jgi:hypothetical protein
LESLKKFYSHELMEEMKATGVVDWTDEAATEVTSACDSLQTSISNTAGALKRAETLQELAKRTETLVGGPHFLQGYFDRS